MIDYWIASERIRDNVYIPKYYNPNISSAIEKISLSHEIFSVQELVKNGWIEVSTGDEIGKAAYGSGDIPFVRTSDISNWEIKSAPKQGVSQELFDVYSKSQDVQVGDILLVRDGTYLIGNNCFITEIDKNILYQSHVLKIRVVNLKLLSPELLFLALNSPLVQKQIRSVQFTADIIDTIGQRFYELLIPIPKDQNLKIELINEAKESLITRARGKAFIKHCPKMIEACLSSGKSDELKRFINLDDTSMADEISNETVSSELGEFTAYWWESSNIKDSVFLPKYYDVKIEEELSLLKENCELFAFKELLSAGKISYFTGDEIGKMSYDTGNIPFLRTSDFANWEIHHNPKQGISEKIYEEYSTKQDVRENDILLVRDGTYLIGSSCLITKHDSKSLFCGGLYKIRVVPDEVINPFLFLGLLNSYIVKRQIRARQFTRDVIDTIGNRIDDVVVPIPRDKFLRDIITTSIMNAITSRIQARDHLKKLTHKIING